ncbi:uncharacterized protein MKK02DRAFT_38166 [Dioszegia hungarica]|uniref:Uncharacterized protein n=1 Tax=Dioszegia hungarica TaxID=4972 RepID=A0AA38H3D9_9TREE|nr:uncharacterized protein MKK02DRAFT_38166 [Dioszegia hungarica]KAI9633513.1 hypothetical protein MKK02DRAFT_38166 [Dioszegia hungarica]
MDNLGVSPTDFDPLPRDPIELPPHYKNAKDGSVMCKAHANPSCKSCFGWKKQINKLHKEGKKVAKKTKPSGSNF